MQAAICLSRIQLPYIKKDFLPKKGESLAIPPLFPRALLPWALAPTPAWGGRITAARPPRPFAARNSKATAPPACRRPFSKWAALLRPQHRLLLFFQVFFLYLPSPAPMNAHKRP